MSVELGPGLIGSIYDGIQRPLEDIMETSGSNLLQRGIEVPSLNRKKVWHFVPAVKAGDEVTGGDIVGTVQETHIVSQKIMVPPTVSGPSTWTVPPSTVRSLETEGLVEPFFWKISFPPFMTK